MSSNILLDLMMVMPIISLFCIGLIPLTIKVLNKNREPRPFFTLGYALLAIVVAVGLTGSIDGTRRTAFHDALVIDGFSIWGSYLVYSITAICLMLAYDHIQTKGRQFAEFVFLLLSSAAGMLVLIMANDLILTFMGIETMSLSLYILIAMTREEVLSKEAAFKYFVMGSFASAIFLYGIALVYGSVGATYIPDILKASLHLIDTDRLFVLGLAMIILGFGFKVAMFPFHSWAPDVYQGSSTPVTAFMATAVKAASFVAFLRLFNSQAFGNSPRFFEILQWVCVLTILLGNVAAVLQDDLKRMLAYSSIAHSGYILVGLIAAGFGTDYRAASGSIMFYLMSYAVVSLGSFGLIALIEEKENTKTNIALLKGFGYRHPVLAACLSALLLSLAGIPPSLGFFAKFYIFSAAISQDMYWMVFWSLIGSVISVYFYLRPIVYMYMLEDASREKLSFTQFQTRMAVVLCALFVIVFGVYSSGILNLVQRSVEAML